MSRRAAALLVALSATAAFVSAQAPSGKQSQGALRSRPGTNREPEFPPPTIRDYRPRSTLVVPQHPRPRAKFPVIDIHSHHPVPMSGEAFDTVVRAMDRNNLRVLVNASGASGTRLREALDALRASRHK